MRTAGRSGRKGPALEIAGLPDLCGFLKLPGVPIGTIQLQYEPHPEVTPAYRESGRALLKPRQSQSKISS